MFPSPRCYPPTLHIITPILIVKHKATSSSTQHRKHNCIASIILQFSVAMKMGYSENVNIMDIAEIVELKKSERGINKI